MSFDVTVYFKADIMGEVCRLEGELVKYGREGFAQYNSAPFITIRRSGGALSTIRETYRPYMLIVAGVGHIEPGSMFFDQMVEGEFVKTPRYSARDSRWMSDFDAQINPLIQSNNVVVIADYRYVDPNHLMDELAA